MIGRVILAALLAGIAAGLVMGIIQQVRLTPLILAAETYEQAMPAQAAGQGHDAHDHDAGWKPANGFERAAFTTVASAMTGAAFAAILAGISLLAGLPLTAQNGLLWGLCGFLAATLAPAAGLPPELPGMPVADLVPRQAWWLFAVAATGIAIYLLVAQRGRTATVAAVLLIAAPHLVGAPEASAHESMVPPGLAAAFAANALAAGAVFWVLIGQFLGLTMDWLASEGQTP
jgi:cobalt transporter subunit CbtA